MRVGGGGPQNLVNNADRFNINLGQVNFNVNVQTRMEPVIDVMVDRANSQSGTTERIVHAADGSSTFQNIPRNGEISLPRIQGLPDHIGSQILERVRQSLGPQGINLPVTVRSEYENGATSQNPQNSSTPGINPNTTPVSNAQMASNTNNLMSMINSSVLGNNGQNVGNGNDILQAISGVVNNLGPMITQVTQNLQNAQPTQNPQNTTQTTPSNPASAAITRQMDSMINQLGETADTTQIGQTMLRMRDAIVSGGTDQSLSSLMASASNENDENEEKSFLTDIIEILMTKLTMQDMLQIGQASQDQVRNIAVEKISKSRDDLRKYFKENWMTLDLPNENVFKILNDGDETEFSDEKAIVDSTLDDIVSQLKSMCINGKKEFNSKPGLDAFKSNMNLYRDFVSMIIRNLSSANFTEKEFGEKVYDEGFVLITACIRLNDYVLKEGREGLTELMSSTDEEIPTGLSNMFIPMVQNVIEKTSQNSSIEQHQWNKYVAKVESDVKKEESQNVIENEQKSSSKPKIETNDVDLMADSENEEEFFDTESTIKKSETTIKQEENKTGDDSWKTVLKNNSTSSDWISTIEADLKLLEQQEKKNDNTDKTKVTTPAYKRRKIEVNRLGLKNFCLHD